MANNAIFEENEPVDSSPTSRMPSLPSSQCPWQDPEDKKGMFVSAFQHA
jgi:hypothetical protein